MLFLIFSCAVLITAGTIFRYVTSEDEFEGDWVGVGVQDGEKLMPFVKGMKYELNIRNSNAEYRINDENMMVHYRGNKLRMELTANLDIIYYISKKGEQLILKDKNGMEMVFKRRKEKTGEKKC